MNLSRTWEAFLADKGYEVRHWSGIGDAGASDPEIMRWARERGFIVMTNDLDFPQILARSREGQPSVILLRGQPLLPENRGYGLLHVLHQCEEALLAGAIVSLDWEDKFRVRLLPIS